ncbi:unnamed protein product, partial [marine sediment metagenome]
LELRIAALLTSMAGEDTIRLEQWNKAQEITEICQSGLVNLYAQLIDAGTGRLDAKEQRSKKERIHQKIVKKAGVTAAQLHTSSKTFVDRDEVDNILEDLNTDGIVYTELGRGNAIKYYDMEYEHED